MPDSIEEQDMMDSTYEEEFPDLKKRKTHNNNGQDTFDSSPRQMFINLLTQVRDNPDSFDEMVAKANSFCDKLDYALWSMAVISKNQSFSQVTALSSPTTSKSPKPQTNQTTLFFKSTTNMNSKQIHDTIKDKIKPYREKILINNLRIVNDKTVKIVTHSKLEAQKLKSALTKNIASLTVEEEKKHKPRIIIFGVEAKMSNEELLEQIYFHNHRLQSKVDQKTFSDNCKIIKRTKESNKKEVNVILQIHPLLRSCLFINDKQKIQIDWRHSNWSDSFFVLRCMKCNLTGHHHTQCNHELSCSRCGGNHETKECPKYKDVRCHRCSLKSKHPEEILHCLGDLRKCVVHAQAIKNMKRRTDYDESLPFEDLSN